MPGACAYAPTFDGLCLGGARNGYQAAPALPWACVYHQHGALHRYEPRAVQGHLALMKGKFTGEARARATRAIVAQADARARLLAPAIAEIRAAGVNSYKGIATQLNARGVPTPARGGRWAATQVRDIVLRKPASQR